MKTKSKNQKEPDWIVRFLEWYSKTNDNFIGEVELKRTTLSRLQKAWGVQSIDPMVDCYPVFAKHAELIKKLSGVNINRRRYDYFLACYQTCKKLKSYKGLCPPPLGGPSPAVLKTVNSGK